MTTMRETVSVRLTVIEPGAECIGCRAPIPVDLAYADAAGWLWCTTCTLHMVRCTDVACDHPRVTLR